jgi:hypothetical protein
MRQFSITANINARRRMEQMAIGPAVDTVTSRLVLNPDSKKAMLSTAPMSNNDCAKFM